MKTLQIMQRPFYNTHLQQRTSDWFFCANTLIDEHNKQYWTSKEIRQFISLKDTKDFCDALAEKLIRDDYYGLENQHKIELYSTSRGKYSQTRMHPYLFVKFAMWLNKEFEVQILAWLTDNLILNRNQAWDYYKEMCKTIQEHYLQIRWDKPNPLVYIQEVSFINDVIGIAPWSRNELDANTLETLSRLQKANINYINMWYTNKERKQKLIDFYNWMK